VGALLAARPLPAGADLPLAVPDRAAGASPVAGVKNVYKLRTLEDVYRLVPEERQEACLAEILASFRCIQAAGELLGVEVLPHKFTWIDDGAENLTLQFQTRRGGVSEVKVKQ